LRALAGLVGALVFDGGDAVVGTKLFRDATTIAASLLEGFGRVEAALKVISALECGFSCK